MIRYNQVVRSARIRLLAKEIAEEYLGRPVEYAFLMGAATGGDVFVRCAAAALATCEDWFRDRDGTEGGDAKAAPGPQPCQARAEGIAQPPSGEAA